MATREEPVWRLPGTVTGQDVKLKAGSGEKSRLSAGAKARLGRIVKRTPEAMVKVTGRARGGAGHLKSHLDYITRNGKLQAETQDGEMISDRARLRELNDDWILANAAEARGRPSLNAAQSVAIILSMPPGTPPDRVEDAARTWAQQTLGGRHDWIMARHDDTKHPHVHVTVRAVGYDGRRLAPGPDDLQAWREGFARELRRLGVEAEATPRQARGVVRKMSKTPIAGMERRGVDPLVRQRERQAAEREALQSKPSSPRDWSRNIQARQDSIRRAYLGHAEALDRGDFEDRQLARDIRRFVADMPVPLTRRQALAVELRQVLDRQRGRAVPSPAPSASSPAEGLHRASPMREPEQPKRPRR